MTAIRRLAVASYDYPPNDGGVSRLASAIVEHLVRRKVAVEVLTRDGGGRTGLPRPKVPTREVKWKHLRREWDTWRYLRRLSPGTHLLATMWNPEATLAWLSHRGPRYVLAHGNEVMPYPGGLQYLIKGHLRRRVLGDSDAVICNSRYTAALVRDIQPNARTEVICPGVAADRFAAAVDQVAVRNRFHLPSDKKVVLSVSRLAAYKGHDVVLSAIASLPASMRREIHYAVAGRGDDAAVLHRMAMELGVDRSVTWLGFVDEAQLPSLYGASDLFVLCTRQDNTARGVEGFGMVFLEAQAAGVPVVGTRAGGIPDAICEGQGGWLIDQDDVHGLAEHLRRLAQRPDEFRVQGQIGRERVRRGATWDRYVDKLIASMERSRG